MEGHDPDWVQGNDFENLAIREAQDLGWSGYLGSEYSVGPFTDWNADGLAIGQIRINLF